MLKIKGTLIDTSSAKVMGILNISPDSFYDGGRYKESSAVSHAAMMLEDGADIIDIGASSSRPGAILINAKDEWERLSGSLKEIRKEFPDAIISIDTCHSEVAKKSLENGVDIINDISAGELDEKMFDLIAHYKVPYIMMHMKGDPRTMNSKASYTNILNEVTDYFVSKIKWMHEHGVHDLVIDPGFGFSKTAEQSFELLDKMDLLKVHGIPLLAGLSRKSMISKILGITPDDALNGTTALNMIALEKGATFIRVHDVKEARQCIMLYEQLKKHRS